MATYLNKVLLKGRLGQEPALRYMPSGDSVCNFSIATRSGQHVEWHKIVAYTRLADEISSTFHTGDMIFVEAEIRTREFMTEEDRKANRKPRKVLELVASEAHLIEKRSEGGEADLPGNRISRTPASQQPGPETDDDKPSLLPKFV